MPIRAPILAALILTMTCGGARVLGGGTVVHAAEAGAVTPPRLLDSEAIERPDGTDGPGRAAVDVELDLTIDADGSVGNVVLVKPGFAAFDDAAVAGVRRFHFEPARRGGVAIPARVRFRQHFPALAAAPPEPTAAPPAGPSDADEPAGEAAAPAGQKPAEEPAGEPSRETSEELSFGATARVREAPHGTTRRTVEGADLVDTPGTRGDALRVIELLPGVARPAGASGDVIIRGNAPSDSEVFFEGTQVLRLYHFGGLTSFVNSRLVEHIDLYPGNFSVRYGRKLGGIVDVGARDPSADKWHALGDVNLFDASALAEGPLGKTVSVALAVRRSWVGDVLKAAAPSDSGLTAAPVYDDYQLFLTWRPTERDRVRFMGYGSRDSLALNFDAPDSDPAVSGAGAAKTYFHRAQLTWEHRYSERASHRAQVALGSIGFIASIGDSFHQDIAGPEIFGRSELELRPVDSLSLTAGVDVTSQWLTAHYHGPTVGADEGDPNQNGPLTTMPPVSIDTSALFLRPAAYLEATWHGPGGLTVIGGGRVDRFGDIHQTTFDPRLTARLPLGEATSLKAGAGLFSQPPSYGQAVAGIGNPNLRAAHALHLTVGIERGLGEAFSFGTEVFAKKLTDLVVANESAVAGVANGGVGRVYGLEATLKARASWVSGFVSYTLSRSERRDQPDSAWRLFDYDQTHILSVASSFHLPRNWEVGGVFRLVTGNPMTPVTGSIYDADRDVYRPIFGAVNSARAPMFHRLDLRVEKKWHPGSMLLATYLDIQNAYNHANVETTGYGFDYRQRVDVHGLPLFPSLGLRGEL